MVNTTPLSLALEVSPMDFARQMFQHTDANGILCLADWYDAHRDDGEHCRDYCCRMNWSEVDLHHLLEEYQTLQKELKLIAPFLNQAEHYEETMTDPTDDSIRTLLGGIELEATYFIYVAPFSATARLSPQEQAICRVSESTCAYELVFHARRLCQLMHLNAPHPVIENEERMLMAALAIHDYGEVIL